MEILFSIIINNFQDALTFYLLNQKTKQIVLINSFDRYGATSFILIQSTSKIFLVRLDINTCFYTSTPSEVKERLEREWKLARERCDNPEINGNYDAGKGGRGSAGKKRAN